MLLLSLLAFFFFCDCSRQPAGRWQPRFSKRISLSFVGRALPGRSRALPGLGALGAVRRFRRSL